MTYCGSLGYGRDPALLFEALDLLGSRGVDLRGVEIHFYGPNGRPPAWTRRYQAEDLVRWHDWVPHGEALRALMRSGVLLSLATPAAQGILTSKIFEYAMLGRPVLSIPPDGGVLDEFVRQAGIGHVGASAEDVASFVLGHLETWRQTGALPGTRANQAYLRQFSRRAQAAKVGEVIRSVLSC